VRIDGELMEIWPNEVCDRFTVLNIEEVNIDICEPIDTPLPSPLDRKVLP